MDGGARLDRLQGRRNWETSALPKHDMRREYGKMIARNIAMAAAGLLLVTASAANDFAARLDTLLRAGQGQIPDATDSDGATTRPALTRAAKMPPIAKPILFCTPEADAVCSALEVLPADARATVIHACNA